MSTPPQAPAADNIGRNSASSVSVHSTLSNHSAPSFGAISIEAPVPAKHAPPSERISGSPCGSP